MTSVMSSLTALLLVVIISSLHVLASAEEAPALVIHPSSYNIGIENEQIHMTCVAYGVPLPKITWKRNDSVEIDPNAITERNLTVNGTVFSVSILEFCAVDMSDIAWYNCTATNGVNGSGIAESTAQFYLHVLEAATEAPSIISHPANTTNALNGDVVEFVCVAYGSPIPDINWYSRSSCSDRAYTALSGHDLVDTIMISGKTFRKSTLKLQNVNTNFCITCNSSNGVIGDTEYNASFFLNIIKKEVSNEFEMVDGTSSNSTFFVAIGVESGFIILLLLLAIIMGVVLARVRKNKIAHNTDLDPVATVKEIEDGENGYTCMSDLQKNPSYEQHTFERNKIPDEVVYETLPDVDEVKEASLYADI